MAGWEPVNGDDYERQSKTLISRTTAGIVLSFIFALFSCPVRPVIPSPYDSKLRIVFTKLNMVFWALVCPEVVSLGDKAVDRGRKDRKEVSW